MERVLGRYEILSELGVGGMGAVYLARHTLLGKTVALKTLLPQLAQNPDYVARFMREARAAANLNHPHIVQVFDVDQAGGQHFFAMERIEGETLQHRIRTHGPLSAAESLRIARQITDALAFAHARGIVHRDLKPANIMLDSRGQVKVMDFGIAAAADSESLTLTGQLLGTPRYMSPEQARGEEVDGRSDLFSLGMTMCEMLAGRTPLHGKDIVSAVGILLQTDQPLILDLPPTVPDDLAAIVVRLTQKPREARYRDAPALAADLARAANEVGPGGTGTVTTPLASTVPAEKLAPRRRLLWAPIAVGLVLLAGFGWWRWQVAHAPAPAHVNAADSTRAAAAHPAATTPPPAAVAPDTTTLAATPPVPPPVEKPKEPPATERQSKKLPAPGSLSPTSFPAPPATEESAAEVQPPPVPAPESPGEQAPDRESVLAAIEPRRREVAGARAAAEQDSAQGTASYRAAQGYEDSLLGFVAAADTGGAQRSADRAVALYRQAQEERAAILAQRSAAAERARAVAEPSHQRSGVARGDSQRKTAEAALASGDFAAARAGFEAARDAYERAGRKSR